MKKKVLFLCTGNSCRSQMAEAIVNAHFSTEWEAVSAGTLPAGYVHPKAIQALSESGIQHEGRSKLADVLNRFASEAKPVRVPRERPVPPPLETGPLVQVETRRTAPPQH